MRVKGRTQGAYLPDASSGGFVVFDQTTDNSSRLAVAITDRTKVANIDGIFLSVDLEVTCDSGIGKVTVQFAELSAYVDPNAEQIELIAYLVDDGTLSTFDAEISIDLPEPPTEVPTEVPTKAPTQVPIEVTPTMVPVAEVGEDVVKQISDQVSGLSPMMLGGIALLVVLLIGFILGRRRRK